MKHQLRYLNGLAAMVLATPAVADVIYSNLQDIAIPATYDGVYLNVETGLWNTDMFSPVSGWDINPYFGGSVLWNSPSFQPVRSGTGNMDAVLNLGTGTIVNGSSVFSTFVQGPSGDNPGGPGFGGSEAHLGASPGQFTAGQEGYLGFKLNGVNHGWMRVVFTNNTGGALIKDWAYEDSGGGIATGNVLQNGSVVTLDSSFGSFTLGSPVTGSNSLIKTGTGTATLAAANTYSGATTVDAGTLVIAVGASTDAASAVAVNHTASLMVNGTVNGSVAASGSLLANSSTTVGGSGTIQGAATVSGNLAPGASAGLLSFGSSLTLADTSATTMEILGMNRGVDYDAINVATSLTYDGMLALNFGSSFGAGSYHFNLFDFGSHSGSFDAVSLDGAYAGTLVNNGSGVWALTNGNETWSFSQGNGELSLVVIPEPGAAWIGSIGLLLLLRRRR